MLRCNVQGPGSAISGNLGDMFAKTFLERYAPIVGGAPRRYCHILAPSTITSLNRAWDTPSSLILDSLL